MPKHIGVFKKRTKKGIRYYGAKWYQGKTHVTRVYGTAEEAAQARRELIKQLSKGVISDKNLTVTDFLKIYLEDFIIPRTKAKDGTRESSAKTIESILRNTIVPYVGSKKLQSLSVKDVDDLQNELRIKYKSSYARSAIDQFKRVLKMAERWKYIKENLVLDIERPKVRIDKPLTLSVDQLSCLLKEADARSRAVIGLAAFAGLRRSEIFGLEWRDIDFKSNMVHIERQHCEGVLKDPKTETSKRIVPILPELKPMLQEWKLKSGSLKWVFPGNRKDIFASSGWIRNHFKPLLKSLDIPEVKFHSLRHFCDKMLHDAGIPTRDIMHILGHTSKSMTLDTYDKISPERLVEITAQTKVFSNAILRNSLRISTHDET